MNLSSTALVTLCVAYISVSSAIAADLLPNRFATAAATSDTFEILAGQLALKKGHQEKVREFGKMMVEQHTQSSAALKKAAAEQGITLSLTMTPELQAKLTSLQGASGPTFDAAYLSTQISVHTKAVELFAAYGKDGAGGPIKAFAQNNLPTIRTHLMRAQAMSAPPGQ